MKWCRFQAGSRTAFGIVSDDDRLTEVEGSPFASYTPMSAVHRLADVRLLVPVVPPTFYAGGLNYPAHVAWWAQYSGGSANLPKEPVVGYRTNNALIAHGEAIVRPADATDEFQAEAELVAVIGKTARNVSEDEALDYVLGYTIGNDVSERTWQLADGSLWRAKNADTFKPMGPWIVTDLDPSNLETTVRINGEVKSQFNTGNMLFGAASHIAKISRYSTLHPGDVVWLGADGATPNMRPGDVVELEVSGIGILRNPVVSA